MEDLPGRFEQFLQEAYDRQRLLRGRYEQCGKSWTNYAEMEAFLKSIYREIGKDGDIHDPTQRPQLS